MTITKITTHIEDAKARLIFQYQKKPNIEAILDSNSRQVQELEDVFISLLGRLDVMNSEGNQLDRLGTIVGQPRLNFDDARYRILIIARIGINISNGEPERIIDIFKLLTEGNFIHYINLERAQFTLATDGTIDLNFVDFLFINMQKAIAGGVRLNVISQFDPTESFAFSGINTNSPAKGFDDGTGTSGGKLAKAFTFDPPFAFAGDDLDPAGFGAGPADPLVGGVFSV